MHEPGTKFFGAQFEVPLVARPGLLGPPSAAVAPGTSHGCDLMRLSFYEDANRDAVFTLDSGLERRTKDAQRCFLLWNSRVMLCDLRVKRAHAKGVGSMRIQQFGRAHAIVSYETAEASQR